MFVFKQLFMGFLRMIYHLLILILSRVQWRIKRFKNDITRSVSLSCHPRHLKTSKRRSELSNFRFNIFLVKRVPGQGPEQRESEKIVLYVQIILYLLVILLLINENHPSQNRKWNSLVSILIKSTESHHLNIILILCLMISDLGCGLSYFNYCCIFLTGLAFL